MNDDDRKEALRLLEGMRDDLNDMKRAVNKVNKQPERKSSLRCSVGIHSYGLTKVTVYGHVYHCRRCGKRKIDGPFG